MKAGVLGDDVFIHFLEHEILDLVGRLPAYGAEARHAFRMSLLIAERTVVPATAYWEEAWAPPLIEEYAPFRQAGRLHLMGTASSPEEYLANKREHYARDPSRYQAYFEEPSRAEYNRLKEMWRMRVRSTTADIAAGWQDGLVTGDVLFERLLRRPGTAMGLDANLESVPQWLGTDAFIADFVVGVLSERGVSLDAAQQALIAHIINRDYVRSFLNELGATALLGGPTRAVDNLLQGADLKLDVQRLRWLLVDLCLADLVDALDPSELLTARNAVEWEVTRTDLLARAGRQGALWQPDELEVVKRAREVVFRDPLDTWRGVCDEYTRGAQAVARKRIKREAELQEKRRGTTYNWIGGSPDMRGAHFGDDYSGATFTGDISMTGGRLQIGGSAINLHTAAPEEVKRAVIELIGRATPDDVVAQLEAASVIVDQRDDIVAADISAEIADAYSGPREVSTTERLKAIAARITEEAAIGAASGGLTSAVLVGLKLIGFG